MMSLDFLADALDGDANIDFSIDLDKYDLDGDGEITAEDCPFPPGGAEAKLWWQNVLEPYVKSTITDDMRSEYGDQVIGAYKGKALVPGQSGPGQGDFQFLVDKIKLTHGLSHFSAVKIAGKIKYLKYGV